MSADLIAFVRARLDEDEARARSAGGGTYGLISHRGGRIGWSDLAEMRPALRRFAEFSDDDEAAFEHIARHDPARVLREVAAKRAIVDAALFIGVAHSVAWDSVILCHLAAAYDDHPDYRQEWTP